MYVVIANEFTKNSSELCTYCTYQFSISTENMYVRISVYDGYHVQCAIYGVNTLTALCRSVQTLTTIKYKQIERVF